MRQTNTHTPSRIFNQTDTNICFYTSYIPILRQYHTDNYNYTQLH